MIGGGGCFFYCKLQGWKLGKVLTFQIALFGCQSCQANVRQRVNLKSVGEQFMHQSEHISKLGTHRQALPKNHCQKWFTFRKKPLDFFSLEICDTQLDAWWFKGLGCEKDRLSTRTQRTRIQWQKWRDWNGWKSWTKPWWSSFATLWTATKAFKQ